MLRHHTIHALCGALMDRHTACRSPHPFCGQRDRDTYIELIAEAIPHQQSNLEQSRPHRHLPVPSIGLSPHVH